MFGLQSYFGFSTGLRLGSPTNQPEETADGQKAADETSSPSEAEQEASASEFQVFLSFRGPDSRQGLADVLYGYMTSSGIRVFRDNDALDPGDRIDKILQAIDNSKICVPIFSESFASSYWCLREVERMVELKKRIMPIFYTATPDDVRLRTDLFKKDLKKHEKKHGREQVKKWEDALRAVGKITGREVKTTGFAEFSTSFVKALLIKLRMQQKNVTNHLVKRQDHEEDMMRLLNTSVDDRRLVGIYGMGGTGKTTLAKVVFNKLSTQFDCCSFLENIQESLRQRDGLQYMQKKLLGDLNPKLKHFEYIEPIGILQGNFRRSKVLIVLDDVNERKQINMVIGILSWFGSGSRIVVTTRNKRVLTKEDRSMRVEEMDNYEALQLFSRHAFGENSPPFDYRVLSNEVLSLIGNLPLAIEIIGSSLYQREKDIWRATIEKLKKVPDKDVKEMLKISFDALEKEVQHIFLDIACFFISKDTSIAIYLWEACNYVPDFGIDCLISLSLVKVTREDKFSMHELIKDLGRQLVRDESFGDPSKRSRIWRRKEADKVLRMKRAKENVQGLYQEWPGSGDLTDEHFSGFHTLRLLKVVDVKLTGDFKDLLPELKCFLWHQCPPDFAAINLSLSNLVVLDLSWSFISEKWECWRIIQMAKHLKSLDLTGCRNIRSAPDLSNNKLLERLSFRNCWRLVELDSSIGRLKRLKHLDLKGCHSLRGLPESIGYLEDLEELLVDGRSNSFNLPDSIGNLCSLSAIELCQVEITRIPDTISGLVNLTRLSMCSCTGMTRLPDCVGDLVSLEELDLSGSTVSMLCDSIGNLAKLMKLNLSKTKIVALPDSVGNLVKLTELRLSETNVPALPDSIGNLVELIELIISDTKMVTLPDSVGKLVRLGILDVSGTRISVLPDSIGNLVELEELSLCRTKLAALPDCIGNLVELTYLDLSKTKMVVLPDSIGNLVRLAMLDLSRTEMPALPDSIGNLVELTVLDVSQTEIAALPDSMGNLVKLKWLMLNSTRLVTVPDWVGNFCELEMLQLEESKIRRLPTNVWSLPMLSDLSCSNDLTEFPTETANIMTCKLTKLSLTVLCAAEISPIIDHQPGLLSLSIDFGKNEPKEVVVRPGCSQSSDEQHLTNPKESSYDCSILTTSSSPPAPLDFNALIRLESLRLKCSGLKGITLRQFPSTLESLVLIDVTPEMELPDLSNLMKVKHIAFVRCSPRDVCALVEGLRPLKRLTGVNIEECTDELVDFSCELERLTALSIWAHPESSKTWFDLSRLKRLEELELMRFKELTEVRGLQVQALDRIVIEDCVSLENIDELKTRCREGYFNGLKVVNRR